MKLEIDVPLTRLDLRSHNVIVQGSIALWLSLSARILNARFFLCVYISIWSSKSMILFSRYASKFSRSWARASVRFTVSSKCSIWSSRLFRDRCCCSKTCTRSCIANNCSCSSLVVVSERVHRSRALAVCPSKACSLSTLALYFLSTIFACFVNVAILVSISRVCWPPCSSLGPVFFVSSRNRISAFHLLCWLAIRVSTLSRCESRLQIWSSNFAFKPIVLLKLSSTWCRLSLALSALLSAACILLLTVANFLRTTVVAWMSNAMLSVSQYCFFSSWNVTCFCSRNVYIFFKKGPFTRKGFPLRLDYTCRALRACKLYNMYRSIWRLNSKRSAWCVQRPPDGICHLNPCHVK